MRDKAFPLDDMKIKEIIVEEVAGTPIVLKVPQNIEDAQATWKSRGKYSNVIENPMSNKKYHVSGEIDFATGELSPLATSGVVGMKIEVSISGGNFERTFTANERREDHEFVVDESISAQYTYNLLDLQDKLTLENIDGVMSATNIIYETAVNAKDYYAFRELNKYWVALEDENYTTGLYTDNDKYSQEVNLSPSDAGNSQYRPADPIQWREKMIFEGMSKLTYQYRDKLEAREGFTSIFWGVPQTTRLVNTLNVVIAEGSDYAGVVSDTSVLVGDVNGQPIKVVSSRRADKPVKVTGQNEYHTLKSIPISNAENEETFKFYQYFTMFDTDGKYRNPHDLVSPTLSYLDLFKIDAVHVIMGELKLTNTDKVFA